MIPEILKRAPEFLSPIAILYKHRFKVYGASSKGVFWNSKDGHELRLGILARFLDSEDGSGITVNDLGCGYGAFFDKIKDMPCMAGGRYVGYDICKELAEEAAAHTNDPRAVFAISLIATDRADYSFACGTFNMNDQVDADEWAEYVKESIAHLWSKTRKGMAFNLLDQRGNKRLNGLFYADREEIAAFCTEHLSPNVEVIEDYALDEFTIFVRR